MAIKTRTLFFIMFITILIIPMVNAVNDINVNIYIKESFRLNETISFDYNILSDVNQKITYTAGILCPNMPAAFSGIQVVDLEANKSYSSTFYFVKIDDSMENQTCVAYVEILSPTHIKKESGFNIKTAQQLSFDVFICKDLSCSEKSNIFILGNSIYLNYTTEIQNISVYAILIYPDKTEKIITLPTSILADKIGNYVLKLKAEKESYLTAEKTIQFGVIEKPTEIKGFGETENYKLIVIAFLGILIVVIAILAVKNLNPTQVPLT